MQNRVLVSQHVRFFVKHIDLDSNSILREVTSRLTEPGQCALRNIELMRFNRTVRFLRNFTRLIYFKLA